MKICEYLREWCLTGPTSLRSISHAHLGADQGLSVCGHIRHKHLCIVPLAVAAAGRRLRATLVILTESDGLSDFHNRNIADPEAEGYTDADYPNQGWGKRATLDVPTKFAAWTKRSMTINQPPGTPVAAASPINLGAADPVQVLKKHGPFTRIRDRRESILVRQRAGGIFHVSSSGHEALSALAYELRPDDYIFPYYRDRAIALARGYTIAQNASDFFGTAKSTSGGTNLPGHYGSRDLNIFPVATPTGSQCLPASGAAAGPEAHRISQRDGCHDRRRRDPSGQILRSGLRSPSRRVCR